MVSIVKDSASVQIVQVYALTTTLLLDPLEVNLQIED